MLDRLHRLPHRTRMIVGFASAVPLGVVIAEVAKHEKWPDDTTMFAMVLIILGACIIILPFMMGPFERLKLPEGERRPRGSFWRLAPGALFPVVWTVAYLILRPHAQHWASAADWAMYVTMAYLLVTNFIFLRTPRSPGAATKAVPGSATPSSEPSQTGDSSEELA